MKIDTFLIKLIFLLIPGILGRIIFRQLKANKSKKTWEDFIEVFLFAISSYAILGGIAYFIKNEELLSNLESLSSGLMSINWIELLWASCISVVIAFLVAFLYNYKIINKIGRLIKITKSFGDEDVWEYVHNSPDIEWVFIRDYKYNLVYYCRMLAFSDSGKNRELLLGDVDLYNSTTSDFLYHMEALYLSRHEFNLSIEIPVLADVIPKEIKKNTFEEEILPKLNQADKKYLLEYYELHEEAQKYSPREELKKQKRLKLRKILDSIDYFSIIYSSMRKSEDISNG